MAFYTSLTEIVEDAVLQPLFRFANGIRRIAKKFRGRFGAHNSPHLEASEKSRQEFVAYTYFIVAYFVPPQRGELKNFGSYDRTVDNVFIEWDRNVIWTATDTGLYARSCLNLGKPIGSHARGRRVA